ncbi:MAG: 16S rRNA (cytidine(1402)-2'-O)-methyltransferase [Nitrospiraceae bacterium]|nr:16S rRNA (cytidine(1402)-2'-O)-methyltransferase [Nitrospiraceae bacterium]
MPRGTLFIVSTPIGNLEDITLRGLRILKEADLIAAEDTRQTRKLLAHYGISKPLVSYWGEREKSKSEEIITRLSGGQTVALVSDAGTPGISDPGHVLISRSLEEGIRVVPVPGPTALISALTISGFTMDRFVFAGFLPAKGGQRKKSLQDLSLEEKTMVFYEAPHRVQDTLQDMAGIFGARRAVLVREITKIHEEAVRGDLDGIAREVRGRSVIGECVIVVEGRTRETVVDMEDALQELRGLMKKGLGRKEAARRVAGAYGMSRKELYDRSLEGDGEPLGKAGQD